jgi:hypothetical protein
MNIDIDIEKKHTVSGDSLQITFHLTQMRRISSLRAVDASGNFCVLILILDQK